MGDEEDESMVDRWASLLASATSGAETGNASLLSLTDDQVTLGVDNLMRLRLVRAAGLTIGDAAEADGIRLTDFGWSFVRAWRPPSEMDLPIRFDDPSVLELAQRNREMWMSPAPPEPGGEEEAQSVATAPESNR